MDRASLVHPPRRSAFGPSRSGSPILLPTLWAGIDEAGHGPNLGPLVMSAVAVRSPDDRVPDLWADLGGKVARAGGDPERLWVDDSKAIYHGGQGRARLEAACLAAVSSVGGSVPATFGALLERLGAEGLDAAEVSPWLDGDDPPFPSEAAGSGVSSVLERRPLEGASWRLTAVRSAVVGPCRFNAGLEQRVSKARVHFDAFAGLLHALWGIAGEGETLHVRSDKHGGRHFYYDLLLEAFPDAWIDRGREGPALSRYVIRQGNRRLALSLQPRADADDGLVALASIVSKTVRELWMDAWNAHWRARVAGLRPTAGYPVDAARFRAVIEPLCQARGLRLDQWWRMK